MSRIIAGAAGGVRLASVPGDNTRPTTDRVKESLFSKLESYDLLRDARVLDAFGGSGALGCEALSRGAASVTLLDTYPKAVAVIRRNVEAVQKAAASNLGRYIDATRPIVARYNGVFRSKQREFRNLTETERSTYTTVYRKSLTHLLQDDMIPLLKKYQFFCIYTCINIKSQISCKIL